MDLRHVHEKLGEARRSLDRMIEQEHRLISEQFTDHLNAFLAAGMAVRDPFQYDNTWRKRWLENLTSYQGDLYEAMGEARDDEAHIARKSRRRRRGKVHFNICVGQEEIKFGPGGSYYDHGSGRIEGSGSVSKKTYSFIIDGKKQKVTDICAEYLALLQRMVADFEAANP